MARYTRYDSLTDDELLRLCDAHPTNELIVELSKRLEEKIEALQEYAVPDECPVCGS